LRCWPCRQQVRAQDPSVVPSDPGAAAATVACPAGSYPTATACLPCPVGTSSLASPVGTTITTPAQGACVLCAKGYFGNVALPPASSATDPTRACTACPLGFTSADLNGGFAVVLGVKVAVYQGSEETCTPCPGKTCATMFHCTTQSSSPPCTSSLYRSGDVRHQRRHQRRLVHGLRCGHLWAIRRPLGPIGDRREPEQELLCLPPGGDRRRWCHRVRRLPRSDPV